MDNIIRIENLTKIFGDLKAVDNLSFSVRRGELFAFLGVNGAGKSTTISILCGLLSKNEGVVEIDRLDVEKNKLEINKKIGVVFQGSVLDQSLNVLDNLKSRGELYGIYGAELKKRIDELAEMLDFKDILKRTVGKLSGGQRRRIDIARALLHKPDILILDEPTTGLDPQTRKLLWKVVTDLRKEDNMTVLLTTHYMEEAVDSDYVIIIDSGKIVAEGTPIELKNAYTGDFITIYNVSDEIRNRFEEMGYKYETIRDAIRVSVANTEEATKLISTYPQLFVDYEVTKGNMDDVFLAVTGKKLLGGNV